LGGWLLLFCDKKGVMIYDERVYNQMRAQREAQWQAQAGGSIPFRQRPKYYTEVFYWSVL
jgi:hypothetical protein